MASLPKLPIAFAGPGVVQNGSYTGDDMQWDFDNRFSLQQDANESRFEHQVSYTQDFPTTNPQQPFTQTAPPFRTKKSQVSDYRGYGTDSRVPDRHVNMASGFQPGMQAAAEAHTVNPQHLVVSRSVDFVIILTVKSNSPKDWPIRMALVQTRPAVKLSSQMRLGHRGLIVLRQPK
jgi:hypothetical protein